MLLGEYLLPGISITLVGFEGSACSLFPNKELPISPNNPMEREV